jgi:cobalt-precorrin-7 (C5)-methyltransferase
MAMKSITIVGCGPGAIEYVTPAALSAIRQARVLVGARRLLDQFPEVEAERIIVGADVPCALDAMSRHVGTLPIAVLVTGDPGLCSLARPVLRRFGPCRVIAGISSVQAAFASVGEDWLGARILSAHDRIPDLDPATLATEPKIALLAGNPATAAWVRELSAALAATHTLTLCENLTLENESVRRADPLSLPMNLSSRTLLLFIKPEDRA